MLRLVHFHDGIGTYRHGEGIESHYRAVRFESEEERAGNDRDEGEEAHIPLHADRLFDRFAEV